jgi:hypothetical protein
MKQDIMMEQDINEKAPPWIPKALEALSHVVTEAYDNLQDDESMPPCFGAISPEPKAGDGFAWGLLNMPDGLDKYEAFAYFRKGLAALLRAEKARAILGGFSITEGWELDTESKERTGKEVLIVAIESPDGWRGTKMFQVQREDGAVSLKPQFMQVAFHLSEEDGNMQGMFSQTPPSSIQ